MAIFYNKIQRRNPSLKKDETKLWYPVLRRVDQVKEKEVAKQIADETTLNPKEAEMAVAQLKKVLINALTNGNSVQLGDWGSFYLSISSKGSEKEDDVSSDNVKKINIRFKPGKEFKEAIEKAQFRDAEALTEKAHKKK